MDDVEDAGVRRLLGHISGSGDRTPSDEEWPSTDVEDAGVLTVGERYMCPALEMTSKGMPGPMWIPILGTPHDDPELGNFSVHVHCDERFLTEEMVEFVRDRRQGQNILNTILVSRIEGCDPRQAAHRAEWASTVQRRPFRCVRTCVDRERDNPSARHPGSSLEWLMLEMEMIRHRVDPRCMVCPHKGMPLSGVPARNGIIVCPGHMLRWREGTGELVPINAPYPEESKDGE